MPCILVEQQTHCLMDVLCGEWTWRNSQEQESNFDGNITRCASQRPTTPLNQQTARRIESLHRTTAQTANECSNTTPTTQERKPSNPKRKRFHSPGNNMKQQVPFGDGRFDWLFWFALGSIGLDRSRRCLAGCTLALSKPPHNKPFSNQPSNQKPTRTCQKPKTGRWPSRWLFVRFGMVSFSWHNTPANELLVEKGMALERVQQSPCPQTR